MEVRPVGAELFHAEKPQDGQTARRTDVTELTVTFPNFVNARKKNYQYGIQN
jgi:hypothetical protein